MTTWLISIYHLSLIYLLGTQGSLNRSSLGFGLYDDCLSPSECQLLGGRDWPGLSTAVSPALTSAEQGSGEALPLPYDGHHRLVFCVLTMNSTLPLSLEQLWGVSITVTPVRSENVLCAPYQGIDDWG